MSNTELLDSLSTVQSEGNTHSLLIYIASSSILICTGIPAVLLFHRNPQKWMFGTYTKIGKFGKGSDLQYQDEVIGSLFMQAERVVCSCLIQYFLQFLLSCLRLILQIFYYFYFQIYMFSFRIQLWNKSIRCYTQGDLAKRLHLSRQAVSKWETGATIPDLEILLQLSSLYDISINDILEPDIQPRTITDFEQLSVIPEKELEESLRLFDEKALVTALMGASPGINDLCEKLFPAIAFEKIRNDTLPSPILRQPASTDAVFLPDPPAYNDAFSADIASAPLYAFPYNRSLFWNLSASPCFLPVVHTDYVVVNLFTVCRLRSLSPSLQRLKFFCLWS